jgi:ElaB/YqjD/DUF883 family membrane-anchored ribosome-binding protein
MKYRTHTSPAEALENLSDDARVLLAATADVAEEHVIEARERLAAALDEGKAVWTRVQDRAIDGAHATDGVIRSHPYHAMTIALGIGAVLGLLASRRH